MGDPDRAFEQLRAEVTVMRRVVEELRDMVEAVPADELAATLATMAKGQAGLLRRIERITDYIGAATPPERLQRELAWARDTALRPAVERLAGMQGETSATLQTLHALIGNVRSNHAQRRALALALALGLALGLAAFPLLVQPVIDTLAEVGAAETARTLPESEGMAASHGQVASAAELAISNQFSRSGKKWAYRHRSFPIGKTGLAIGR